MENIDIKIAEILGNYLLNGDAANTATQLKELFGHEQLLPIHERVEIFTRSVFAWNYKYKEKYDSELLKSFIELWTRIELNMKMKFENQPTFKIGGRLATYSKTKPKFENKNRINKLKKLVGAVNPLR